MIDAVELASQRILLGINEIEAEKSRKKINGVANKRAKKWRDANPEKVKKNRDKYNSSEYGKAKNKERGHKKHLKIMADPVLHEEHKRKDRERHAKWRETHPIKERKQAQTVEERNAKRREKFAEQMKDPQFREKRRLRAKKWREENPEKYKQIQKKHREKKSA